MALFLSKIYKVNSRSNERFDQIKEYNREKLEGGKKWCSFIIFLRYDNNNTRTRDISIGATFNKINKFVSGITANANSDIISLNNYVMFVCQVEW